jgi:hypothetical protein
MSKLIPAAERMARARTLIEKARQIPRPDATPQDYFTFVANVKDLMQQARDLIKFIPYSPSTTPEMKEEVNLINQETVAVEKEILHRPV